MPGFPGLTPLGGWFGAEDLVLDSAVFDFGPRTDAPKASADAGATAENTLQNLAVVHAFPVGASTDGRPTRNAAHHIVKVTAKSGDSGVLVAFWQNGAGGTPVGLVYSFSLDGVTWSVPVQVSSRTNIYATPILRPDTNDIYVMYSGISRATAGPTYMRAMAYTGTPGAPSWAIGVETVLDAAGVRGLYAGDTDETGFTYWWGMRSDANPDRVHSRRMTAPFDPLTTSGTDLTNQVNGLDIWVDAARVPSYAGSWLLGVEQGGTFRIYWVAQEGGTAPALGQLDTFFMSDSEEYSIGYSATVNQLCVAYINGSNLVYKIYSYTNDGVISTLVAPTTISDGVHGCHSPMVQVHADGTFYIAWIEETVVTAQRRIRCVNTSAVGTIFDLVTDAGSNAWHDLSGPRTTGDDQQLKFAWAETANATNQVWVGVAAIPATKSVSDSGAVAETFPAIGLAVAETPTATDSPAQTYVLSPTTCMDGRRLYDEDVYDAIAYDSACQHADVAEFPKATEILSFGPQLLETATATDAVAGLLGVTPDPETGTAAEGLDVAPPVQAETGTAVDAPSLDIDPDPTGLGSDAGTGDDEVSLLEVLADDLAAALETYDVAQTVDDPAAATEAMDLATTSNTGDTGDDTATAAEGTMDVAQEVDETATAADDLVLEVLADDAGTASELLADVAQLVADAAAAVDSDPSSDVPVSHDVAETATGAEGVVTDHRAAISVTLAAYSGKEQLRADGGPQDPIITPQG